MSLGDSARHLVAVCVMALLTWAFSYMLAGMLSGWQKWAAALALGAIFYGVVRYELDRRAPG